jgi:hypothetical protein
MNTLDSFRAQKYNELPIEISICDDGSVDDPIPLNWGEKEASDFFTIVSWREKKKLWTPPAASMNQAVRQSTAPYLLLQSPEIYHHNAIIEAMKKGIENPEEIILCSVIDKRYRSKWSLHPHRCQTHLWWCQMMTREMFERVDGFDEAFVDGRAAEDTDFHIRLVKAGCKYKWLDPDKYLTEHMNVKQNWEYPPYEIGKKSDPNFRRLLKKHNRAATFRFRPPIIIG